MMPGTGRHTHRAQRRRHGPAEARRRFILDALERPRTQAELRDALGMSNSGILHLLRRMERDGLVRPAERIAWTRIWERTTEPAAARHS
ncbi:winged helix-turn-helix domain-containing protein [Lutimaribacter sp. EGI FJ00015]|uniref:Winged helix-turn-helix domain-containing protein n=1 Tax=Lutimaribacter degradans TaxID=2945989 RepID=A0ACC6A2D6_9RHOB|nr:winged helix-turn-helix domain-containing protein [Lutimaribacter sp. EGI FJ00013]MCM2563919.1 winged helix-turn-helix domain-containing protein [Lutimaribacter sp. EGI FJ00013]MCO0615118.1 winged helix-turn-helix domain-containing protein [Lutimaribacter sp. EGI FJ00015]MCO0637748.1 winged helix-turn-helix domain-containing protein [Lutimaribacter sp. EGI FJ00014]